MSATVDADKFSTYFGGACIIAIPGRTFPVDRFYLADTVDMIGYQMDEKSPFAVKKKKKKMKKSSDRTPKSRQAKRNAAIGASKALTADVEVSQPVAYVDENDIRTWIHRPIERWP